MMKKIIIRNSIVVLSLVVLSVVYNLVFRYLANQFNLSLISYIPIIIYALLCGASLMLLDLSNRRMNIGLSVLCLAVVIAIIQFPIFANGTILYVYLPMLGALVGSIFRKTK